ncbi:MAG: DUF4366 domain-containing protein [Oscillospiraceae bacterium]|nr:DUF4366 domain-containing protein [Oscillospiraceae bacterium]
MKITKFLYTLTALMLMMGALLFSVPAYAAEPLTVDAVWLTGDTLHIEVTDEQTGINQTLELPLSDYAGNSEFVSVQAADKDGNLSNTIQFKNPFYDPEAPDAPVSSAPPSQSESIIPDGTTPLTPDGSGTVVDNATEGDGKEFFSVETADGNVFYLVVDRQRNTDNVYLLNAVTENDLESLAKPGDGITVSGVPSPEPSAPPASPEPAPKESGGAGGGGTLIFVLLAAVIVGGAGYYFKIVRPKKMAQGEDDDYEEEPDYEDIGEEGDEQ